MSRPEVSYRSPDDTRRVVSYYRRKPSQRVAEVGHAIMGTAFSPRITEDDGAIEQTGRLINEGHQIVLSPVHSSNLDSIVLPALVHIIPEWRLLMGKIRIATKTEMSANPILRYMLDELGQVPTPRQPKEDATETEVEAFEFARDEYSALMAEEIEAGMHIAGFWEGTRNKGDKSKVQKVRGIGRILNLVDPEVDLAIVPIGIRHHSRLTTLTPTVYVGTPLLGPFIDPKQTNARVEAALQLTLTPLWRQ